MIFKRIKIILLVVLLFLNSVSSVYAGLMLKIWNKKELSVCWIQDQDKTLRNRVRWAVENSWAYYSDLKFTGWDICKSATYSAADIKINIFEGDRSNSKIGTDSINAYPSMNLRLKRKDDMSLEGTAVHEFGHAIGFIHEQARTDTPQACLDQLNPDDTNNSTLVQGNGNNYLGEYDAYSVMNYCEDYTGMPGFLGLSNGDIYALQFYYGKGKNEIDVSNTVEDTKAPVAEKGKSNSDGDQVLLGKDGKLYKKDGDEWKNLQNPFAVKSFSIDENGQVISIGDDGKIRSLNDDNSWQDITSNVDLSTAKDIISTGKKGFVLKEDGSMVLGEIDSNTKNFTEKNSIPGQVTSFSYDPTQNLLNTVDTSGDIKQYSDVNGILIRSLPKHSDNKKFTKVTNLGSELFAQDENGNYYQLNASADGWQERPELQGAKELLRDKYSQIGYIDKDGKFFTIEKEGDSCRMPKQEFDNMNQALEEFSGDYSKDLNNLTKMVNGMDFMEKMEFKIPLATLFTLYMGQLAFAKEMKKSLLKCPGIIAIAVIGAVAVILEVVSLVLLKLPLDLATDCMKNLAPDLKQRESVKVILDTQLILLYRYAMTGVFYLGLWGAVIYTTIVNIKEVSSGVACFESKVPSLMTPQQRAVFSGLLASVLSMMVMRIFTLLPAHIELRKKFDKHLDRNYSFMGIPLRPLMNFLLNKLVGLGETFLNFSGMIMAESVNQIDKNFSAMAVPPKQVKFERKGANPFLYPQICIDKKMELDKSCSCQRNHSCFDLSKSQIPSPEFNKDLQMMLNTFNNSPLDMKMIAKKLQNNIKSMKKIEETISKSQLPSMDNLKKQWTQKNFLKMITEASQNPRSALMIRGKKLMEENNISGQKDFLTESFPDLQKELSSNSPKPKSLAMLNRLAKDISPSLSLVNNGENEDRIVKGINSTKRYAIKSIHKDSKLIIFRIISARYMKKFSAGE